jgi:hypothetical protein
VYGVKYADSDVLKCGGDSSTSVGCISDVDISCSGKHRNKLTDKSLLLKVRAKPASLV